MDPAAPSELQLIGGLLLAVLLLLLLVLRTKIHAVLALVAAASVAGLVGGMPADEVVASITRGFGNTLSTIGLVIGFGVMMGRLLEVSGAAERMAYSLIEWLGEKREEWALTVTGYVVSVPIFCDSAFVILVPLVKALSKTTGKSVITLGICLAGGLMLTHHAIPPTPGPLGIAGIFDVDIGLMIMWGTLCTLPGIGVIVWYARRMGPRIETTLEEDVPSAEEAFETFKSNVAERSRDLPSVTLSMAPIVVPIFLIFLNTGTSFLADMNPDLAGAAWIRFFAYVGNPVIAVGIGVVLAAYTLVPGRSRDQVVRDMEKGVESAGIILLVTGAGGALGAVLRDSGAGDVIGESIATLAIPAILIPFAIASIMRLVQGSGTVAMITGASISAPILMAMPDVNMVFAAQAAAIGSMVFSYFNDSYFWVVNRMLGVTDAKQQMLTWSVPTTLGWLSSLVMLLILYGLFG
ncbi:MAG: gluconate:H+ symporter [Rhodothermales bacterium]